MPVLPASLLHAGSEAHISCLGPSEEKLAVLALSISAERGEPPARGPRQELYVGDIRDALMPHGPECRRAVLAVAVDRSGTARAGVALHGERLRDVLPHMMSETADPCAFKDYASLPARMDRPSRVNWIGMRRGQALARDSGGETR